MIDYFKKVHCKDIFEHNKMFVSNEGAETISFNSSKTIYSRIKTDNKLFSNDLGGIEKVSFQDIHKIIQLLNVLEKNKEEYSICLKYGSIHNSEAFPRFLNIESKSLSSDFVLTKSQILKDPKFPDLEYDRGIFLSEDHIKTIKKISSVNKPEYIYFKVDGGTSELIFSNDIKRKNQDKTTYVVSDNVSTKDNFIIKLRHKHFMSIIQTFDSINITNYGDKALILFNKSEHVTSEFILTKIKK